MCVSVTLQYPPDEIPGPIDPVLSVPINVQNSGAAPPFHAVPRVRTRPCRSGNELRFGATGFVKQVSQSGLSAAGPRASFSKSNESPGMFPD